MKKIVAIILALVTVLSVLTGCTTTLVKDKETGKYDKGAVIDMYLTDCIYYFDPQQSITDESQLKLLSLVFEGLTYIDENGKWQKALMKEYEVDVDDGENFSILITINDTRWTDGRTVQAADFVYSWKRLLDPEQKNEAASLLYDVKNARACKTGDATIDDLGIYAVDTYVLKVEFEEKIDVDQFMENCSSIALVPLREDVVSRYGDDDWAMKSTSIITNGPFALKDMSYDRTFRIERSTYYYLDPEKEEYLDKFVVPYRLMIDYNEGDVEEQFERYLAGEILYEGEIPLSYRAEYKDKATVTDMMSTHTYVFNTTNPLFEKAEVRRALSLAIDRNEIVNIVTFAKPATGYIPAKVFDANRKTEFRTVGGELISASANVEEAKSLLKSAGVSGGSFTLTVRDKEVDLAIAEYVKGVWQSLGFKVKIEAVNAKITSEDKTYIADDVFQTKYDTSDFDVIAIDMTMLAPDAYSALAQYALEFSGNGVDMNSETYDLYGHVSGYHSEEYDALIDAAYSERDRAARTEILHDAEEMLLEDMPVIPLVVLQDAYLAIDDLKKIDTTYYGVRDFKDTELKNYMNYKDVVSEDAE